MENLLRPVIPAEPAAPWIGGKRLLARRICAILAATPHDCYAEPFVGMGGVFLRRGVRPPAEVINDVSGDIVTLYRVLQRHPEALLRELRWRPAMRVEFDRLKSARIQDLTDIERAARFLYLQTLAYGGKVTARSFGVDTKAGHAFDLKRLEPRLERLHERLAGVIIEHLDWADFLPRYARPGTLFYLDPPYWGSEGDYGPGLFARADFDRLAAALAASDARVLVSINDVPEVRTAFAWAEIQEVETRYQISGESQKVSELLIGRGVNLQALEPQARLL
ncbi:DNA adenine methylase [Phenylobacterium sp.]|uniref:DNA adenine methylase n=1 Tax=Phenylobacterium sp. TaxID=1871053 RepID=UPI00273161AB|nr:DNA adenine methylase [Phenylobacterium sp.]MDP1872546.1 DNA adenine methylase [Phenylobacterium sp.]